MKTSSSEATAPSSPIATEKVGLWLALGSITMLFAGFLSAQVTLSISAPEWPPEGLPSLPATIWIPTALLLASQATLGWAQVSVQHDRTGSLRTGLSLSAVLGLAFLAGQVVVARELAEAGLRPEGHVYGGLTYLLIGSHAILALIGVIVLVVTAVRAARKRYTAGDHVGLEIAAIHWHYVGALWLVLFTALSIGTR